MTGIEPATSCSRSRRTTRLCYISIVVMPGTSHQVPPESFWPETLHAPFAFPMESASLYVILR